VCAVVNMDKDNMLLESLDDLIKQTEGQNLEFKRRPSEELGKSICSFANTNDGIILVGISDNKQILGVEEKDEQKIASIAHTCKPSIYPRIERIKTGEKTVFVVKVKNTGLIHSYKNIAYKRIGSSDEPLSPEEVIEFAKSIGKIQFDSMICEEAKLKDINEDKVRWYLERREGVRGIKKPEKMPFEQLLLNIGAVRETKDGIKPTNAGILFFSENPQRFILQSQLRLARFAGKELTRNFLDRLDSSGTIWEMLEQAEDFMRKNIRLFGFRTEFSFRRIDKLEYPMKAIREGIINALIHRNYYETADTRVMIFDDRIEIVNPGSFPEGVTPEKPRHIPVNPVICQLMYDVGFIERYGTGIYMINELCEEYGIPKPEYEISKIETKLIFRSGGGAVVISEIEKSGIELNKRQSRALKYAFREGFITSKIYADINEVSSKTASLELSDLLRKGLLNVEGRGRSTKYIPKL